MEKNKKFWNSNVLLFLISISIFLILSSVSSVAIIGWDKYKANYWQTGSSFEYIGKFDEGYHYIDIGIGSLYLPIAFYQTDVANNTILVVGSTTGYLYAFKEVSDLITTIDTIQTGSLTGQMGGFDKETSDGKFNVAGIFDVGAVDYFRVYDFNGTDWSLMYNFTTATLTEGGDGVGVTCRDYDGADYCVFIDNNGTLYEVNIDTLSYSSYANLGTSDSLYQSPYRTPVVESIRMDGTYQAIFQSNYDYDGGYSYDLVSWDLTNNELDSNFGGMSGDPIGVVIDAMEGSPTNTPVVAQVGVWCEWLFGLFPYNCQPAGNLELMGFSGNFNDMNAYLWDSSGTELEKTEFTTSVSHTAGDIGVMDCDDDGRLDLIVQIWDRDLSDKCIYLYCFDASDNLDMLSGGGKALNGANPSGCYVGTGIAIADFNRDGDEDIATSSGVYDIDFTKSGITTGIVTLITDWTLGYGSGEFQQAPIIIDFDGDSLADLVYVDESEIRIYMSNATNENPQFTGDGTDVDTCVPLCVNETITYYARKTLDYIDEEGDSAYLGVDCYDLGVANITWSSLAVDPEVSCTYDSLGYWDVPVFITDISHFPSYTESQSFGIYTALSSNCYDSGEWQEECDPSSDIDELEGCFTDSGVSVCLVQGTSVAKCDECDCDEIANNKCLRFYPNGTQVEDRYEARLFDWSQCSDWEGSMWYGACPLFIWTTNSLNAIWNWIFGAFWIFLTLILVVLVIAILMKRRGR